jgi:hypothetical protein
MRQLMLFATLVSAVPAFAQTGGPYGSIADLKLAKPEDGQDQPTTPPPAGAKVLFDGKSLDGWAKRDGKTPAAWKLLDGGVMQAGGGDILTKEKFAGPFKVHVEFRVPYMPSAKGQGRGNSGVYVHGRYEVQILDSYGLESKKDDCGAIYTVAAPKVNACKAPTVWQSYDIDFTPPPCEAGKKTGKAIMTVRHNGVLIHEKVEIPVDNTTAGNGGDPCTPGPIMLQDHGNPVQFRNVWMIEGK